MADELEMTVGRLDPSGRPTLYRAWRASRLVGVIRVCQRARRPRFQPFSVDRGRWREGPTFRSRPKALEWLNDPPASIFDDSASR